MRKTCRVWAATQQERERSRNKCVWLLSFVLFRDERFIRRVWCFSGFLGGNKGGAHEGLDGAGLRQVCGVRLVCVCVYLATALFESRVELVVHQVPSVGRHGCGLCCLDRCVTTQARRKA